jgi:hypothetical protein
MISADLSLPEWNWLGPWFAAAQAQFANDEAASLAVSCFALTDATTLVEIGSLAQCSVKRAAEIVATFIDAGLIVAGEFDRQHPGHLFLVDPVRPQTGHGHGHGRRDMQ